MAPICTNCKRRPAAADRKLCSDCLAYAANSMQIRRMRARDAKICLRCMRNPSGNYTACRDCRMAASQRNQEKQLARAV